MGTRSFRRRMPPRSWNLFVRQGVSDSTCGSLFAGRSPYLMTPIPTLQRLLTVIAALLAVAWSPVQADEAPTIIAEPQARTISAGDNVALTVAADGGSLGYQWFEGPTGNTSSPVPGASGSLLVTPPLQSDTSYWVRVTNPAGSVDSQGASVTISAPLSMRLLAMGSRFYG